MTRLMGRVGSPLRTDFALKQAGPTSAISNGDDHEFAFQPKPAFPPSSP